MLNQIHNNIRRQERALDVLAKLLEEEFSCLTGRDPQAVTGVELSLQELLRQIAEERLALKKLVQAVIPGARGLAEFAEAQDTATRTAFEQILRRIDQKEQHCAIQAEKNAQLAFALAEQSRDMLDFMHKQVQPRDRETYGRSGRFASHHPQAAILQGRL